MKKAQKLLPSRGNIAFLILSLAILPFSIFLFAFSIETRQVSAQSTCEFFLHKNLKKKKFNFLPPPPSIFLISSTLPSLKRFEHHCRRKCIQLCRFSHWYLGSLE